jgi:hypothetical protein
VGGQWFYLAGILKPAVLAPAIDISVLIGYPAAEKYEVWAGGIAASLIIGAVAVLIPALRAACLSPTHPSPMVRVAHRPGCTPLPDHPVFGSGTWGDWLTLVGFAPLLSTG